LDRRTFLTILGSTAALNASTYYENNIYMSTCKEFLENASHKKAFILDEVELKNYTHLSNKVRNLRNNIGFGNFNLLSFDAMIEVSTKRKGLIPFTHNELELFEKIFFENANNYGFYGEKVSTKLTEVINPKDTLKVPYTGHYIYRGESEKLYRQIKKDIGKEIILTSGVRSVVKQMDLFLRKVVRSNGNISVASRSLAPAGYSYHGTGDFDVGKVGFGHKNFTSDFSKTDEFSKLMKSGYINIRYTKNNPFGVRYEPWHIKVV